MKRPKQPGGPGVSGDENGPCKRLKSLNEAEA
jgi:hypothetical protein